VQKNSLEEKNEVSQLLNLSVLVVIITLLLMGGMGCKKEEVTIPMAPLPKTAAAPVQTAITTEKSPDYIYNAAGKRDPFKTFIEAGTGKKAHSVAPATPLQSYDLAALRLVGIMLLPGKKVAIIEDPTGKGYHVKVGTSIGMNDGVVVEILKDEVVVEEKYLDETAQTKARKVSVKIPKEDGQGGEVR
jgi:type IV pilus assembly protein PilP